MKWWGGYALTSPWLWNSRICNSQFPPHCITIRVIFFHSLTDHTENPKHLPPSANHNHLATSAPFLERVPCISMPFVPLEKPFLYLLNLLCWWELPSLFLFSTDYWWVTAPSFHLPSWYLVTHCPPGSSPLRHFTSLWVCQGCKLSGPKMKWHILKSPCFGSACPMANIGFHAIAL